MSSMLKSLDEIGLAMNTDKSSKHHNYLVTYDEVFSLRRHEPLTLIELGVGPTRNKGKSLLTWREYFPSARIIGVDIRDDAKEIESDNEGIEVVIGNCGDISFLHKLARDYKPDIIIDDASHKWSHQILAFECLFPALNAGGVYICEDLATSFPPGSQRKAWADHDEDAVTYFCRLFIMAIGGGRMSHYTSDVPSSLMQKQLSRMIKSMRALAGALLIYKR